MNSNPTTQDLLLTATQQLTQPHYDLVITDETIHGTTTQRLLRDGKLKQLRDAITGGIGSHEGSSPGRERIPFDTGALELYDKIEREITTRWVTVTGKPVHLELETTLTNWYMVTMQRWERKEFTDEQLDRILFTVEGWGKKIDGHFDKPKQLELTIMYREPTSTQIRRIPAPCPACGESYAHNPTTGDKTFALILEYREVRKDTMHSSVARCRFCGAEWRGGSGARELAYAMEQFELTLAETGETQ